MFNLNQSFTFDTDAETVVAHIMGGTEWRPENRSICHATNGVFTMQAIMSVSPGLTALFVIAIMASITQGTDGLDYSEKSFWILHNAEIATITLKQEQTGKCTAELWVENDPIRWGSEYTGLWHVGPALLAIIWNHFITDWLKRTPAKADHTGQGDEELTKEKVGLRVGTSDRVREAHKLLKQAEREGKSRAWAFKQSRTDSRTYYQWCERATGEKPLLLE